MMKRNIVALIGAAAVLAALQGRASAQSSTAGAIQGAVKDKSNGEGMIGVTVVATSPALQGSQSAITDDGGQFKLSNLPPGVYVVRFYYADAVVTRTNVAVSVNRVTPVHVKFDTHAAKGEEIVINDAAPTIDPTSTTQGVTLDRDYTDNIPVPGRNFESALGAAAGTQGDALGVSFSGSTSLENSYTVDGLNTTGLSFGTVGSPIINDFIKEIEIITGGYQAEYGRATGGIVNVVTQSGTNEFHGRVFGYFDNDFLSADPRRTPSQSTSIDAESKNVYDASFGFSLGGPIIKDKLWFWVGFSPRLVGTDIIKITKRRTDCRMTLPDGSLSTPADQPCTRAQADMFGDGTPDVDPETGFLIYEDLSRRTNRANAQQYQFSSKLNYSLSPDQQGQLSFSGSPNSQEVRGVNGDPVAITRQSSTFTTDLVGKWTSKFNDSKTQLEATLGWHRSKFDSRAKDPVGDVLPHQSLFFGSLNTWSQLGFEDQATVNGCFDTNQAGGQDPYPGIVNCPDEGVGYNIGGVGAIGDQLEQRVAGKLSATQRINAAGNHEIKGGIDFEDNRLNKKRLLSGGTFFQNFLGAIIREQRWVQLAPPGSTDPRFDETCGPDPNDPVGTTDRACDFLDPQDPNSPNDVKGNTFNWAAYLRDSWQVLPNLTLNAGVRYEEQRLRYSKELQNSVDPFTGNELGTNAMVMRNMWAPRVGLIYDWTKEGRSKVYASFGRFYESIPMDINDRSFGGETLLQRDFDPGACGAVDPALGAPDANNCISMDAAPQSEQLFGSGVLVAPGIKPQYLDEFILGVEYEVMDDLKLGVSYQNRRLGRVLEDVSVDNAATYILANPGEFDSGAESDLINQINALPDGDPERTRLENQLADYQKLRIFDKPRRDYNAVTISATKRFSRNLFMQASYTYSRTEGNYPGLFSADNGQVDPNITSQYDLIELLANRDGPLPQDKPHYFKLEGYYHWKIGNIGTFTPGVRVRALSGVPINVLGRHYLYGFNESFLLPRGAGGRTEDDYSLDLRLAYERDVGNGMRLGGFLDLRSIFNTQGTFAVDRAYTFDSANPIVGGKYEDLIWAKSLDRSGLETADPITRNPNFGNTTVRYSPFSAQFGARLSF